MKPHHNILDGVDRTKLAAYLKEDGSDGWTIWAPSKFTSMGFKLKDLPMQVYKSDTRDPKSTIFHNGKVVKKLEGVYNLTMLRKIAVAAGASTHTGMMGRGSDARALTVNIKKALNLE